MAGEQRDKLGGHCKQQSQLQVIVDCPKREALETERRALFQIHFDWGGGFPSSHMTLSACLFSFFLGNKNHKI